MSALCGKLLKRQIICRTVEPGFSSFFANSFAIFDGNVSLQQIFEKSLKKAKIWQKIKKIHSQTHFLTDAGYSNFGFQLGTCFANVLTSTIHSLKLILNDIN